MDGASNPIVKASKQCNRCCLQKPLADFSRRSSQADGLQTKCRACARAIYLENHAVVRARQKAYWEKNKEVLLERQRAYWHRNKDTLLPKQRDYHATNKQSIRDQQRDYRAANRQVIAQRNKAAYLKADRDARAKYAREYNAEKRKSDPLFRLKESMRTRTSAAMRRGGYTKKSGMTEILGCDWGDLCRHLEPFFAEWMTWENYGTAWVVDHHIPLASAADEAELMRLCHYTNLRPLDKAENLRKAANMPPASS